MPSFTIIDTTTSKTVGEVSGMCVNIRDAKARLLALRQPGIEAKLAATGKRLNTIEVKLADNGRWQIGSSRYDISYKSFVPQAQPSREPGGKMVEVFGGMRGFAMPADEARAYGRKG